MPEERLATVLFGLGFDMPWSSSTAAPWASRAGKEKEDRASAPCQGHRQAPALMGRREAGRPPAPLPHPRSPRIRLGKSGAHHTPFQAAQAISRDPPKTMSSATQTMVRRPIQVIHGKRTSQLAMI